jgi:hypothetical protein
MKLFRLSRTLLWIALFSGVAVFAAPDQPVEPRVTLERNEGFCPNGAVVPLVPAAGDPRSLNTWGAYCYVPQRKPLAAATTSFIAPKYFRIYLTGYSQSPTLALERVSDHSKFLLVPWNPSLWIWSVCDYRLPSDWQGKPVRLVVEDTKERGFWRAFSEPLTDSGKAPIGDAITLLSLTTLHFFAIVLCAAALTALAIWRGLRDVVNAGLIALAGTALPGYCCFWLTLLSPRLGHYVAVFMIAAAVAGLVFCVRKLDGAGRRILKSLLSPLLLIGAAALLVLSSGFLYGGFDHPIALARVRFSHPLPSDNEIPLLLAEDAYARHIPRPLFSDWLSSDRPPLQSGIVLSQFPLFHKPRGKGYTTVSVLAQSFWIFALWLLLTAFRLKSRAIVLVLAGCLFSGFIFVNSFYVWPKLLAAAYTLGFFASFVAPGTKRNSALQSWITPGALLSFSLLSHGGTAFALIPMVPLMLFFKRPWPIKRMLATLSFAFILYLPWTLYQKFYDPPGDRLLKYHLAGVESVDSRSFLEAAKASYGALSFHQIMASKIANFDTALGGGFQNLASTAALLKELVSPGGLVVAAPHVLALRSNTFFRMAACLGVFILAPFALIAGIAPRFRSPEWRTACLLWILTFASIVIWCLLMFTPRSTDIHQGAYATVLFAMAASVLSLWALSPRLALILTLTQMGLNFMLYGPLTRVPYPNGLLPEGILHVDTLLLCIFSFAAVLALFWNLARRESFSADAIPP